MDARHPIGARQACRCEDDFTDATSFDGVDALLSHDVVHHLPAGDVVAGGAEMTALGEVGSGRIHDAGLEIALFLVHGDLFTDRTKTPRLCAADGRPISSFENQSYRALGGRIVHMCPAGVPID